MKKAKEITYKTKQGNGEAAFQMTSINISEKIKFIKSSIFINRFSDGNNSKCQYK
jgi:hypothetical protein